MIEIDRTFVVARIGPEPRLHALRDAKASVASCQLYVA
jgi:hypothetical protein